MQLPVLRKSYLHSKSVSLCSVFRHSVLVQVFQIPRLHPQSWKNPPCGPRYLYRSSRLKPSATPAFGSFPLRFPSNQGRVQPVTAVGSFPLRFFFISLELSILRGSTCCSPKLSTWSGFGEFLLLIYASFAQFLFLVSATFAQFLLLVLPHFLEEEGH